MGIDFAMHQGKLDRHALGIEKQEFSPRHGGGPRDTFIPGGLGGGEIKCELAHVDCPAIHALIPSTASISSLILKTISIRSC